MAPVALRLLAFSRGAHARLDAARQHTFARTGCWHAATFLRACSARQSLALKLLLQCVPGRA